MAPHRVNTSQAGFTLIEVMIAVLLTAIAVMGIVGIFMVQSRGGNISRHTTEASVLAQDKMEDLRTQTTPASATETNINAQGLAGGTFTRTSTVTVGTADITYQVAVSWSEDGITRNVTLRSKRGL
jgi:prepilin-type N-terminal cleavage/methylation domain-containing protein